MGDSAPLKSAAQNRHVTVGGFRSTLARRIGLGYQPLAGSSPPTLEWDALACRILDILLLLKRQRRTFLKRIARRRISLEQLTAAAIAGAVAEFVEAEETTVWSLVP